ncbi:sigma-54 interaction domain-containing protein [Mangrovibacillus cuniculi]|uniref:sigma-54 interaction domain-containing protein n=1 Tax=Mangrovibacillus cuniculi TaxID=2593652 RepID=UPI001EFA12FD|nr:sigma-54-dependent Fis family transcriptional regulator [Mangrovibacillus cuniculi]
MLHNVLVIGAGKGGVAVINMLSQLDMYHIVGVVDQNEQAPGIHLAKQLSIPTSKKWKDIYTKDVQIIFDVTGNLEFKKELENSAHSNTQLISGTIAHLVSRLLKEKEQLIEELENTSYKQELIFNATNDGMIVVDPDGVITFINESAERMTGLSRHVHIGMLVSNAISTSQLMRILETKRTEVNQRLVLPNGRHIITTRIPIISEDDQMLGAFAVFKDVTEIVHLAEELTDLKDVHSMLEAIIHSSDEAISVVDEHGTGLMVNPAYSRITGLSKEEIIGKGAQADIYEGESVHLQVLNTRKPVRGVRMKVGPNRKEVIVNVAPIIVNGKLKGSVGVIHDVSEIKALTEELSRARKMIRSLEETYTFEDIIAVSEEMSLVVEQARVAAKTPAAVLLRGDSGTGKELLAHAIHYESDRKYNKFVRVHCGSFSKNMAEQELFGFEGEEDAGFRKFVKRGFFEEAHGGTIFLDEIADLPLTAQTKLLRVLQDKELWRIGGKEPIPIQVRVIAASAKNLEKEMARGTFREDLYYRLNRMPIQLPPLKRRKEDIPTLSQTFIDRINTDFGRSVKGIDEEAMKRLMEYDWPGNIRELENVLSRALIFMDFHKHWMTADDLPSLTSWRNNSISFTDQEESSMGLVEKLEHVEKTIIQEAIQACGGNKTAAAKRLQISVRNLYYKLEKYEIEEMEVE